MFRDLDNGKELWVQFSLQGQTIAESITERATVEWHKPISEQDCFVSLTLDHPAPKTQEALNNCIGAGYHVGHKNRLDFEQRLRRVRNFKLVVSGVFLVFLLVGGSLHALSLTHTVVRHALLQQSEMEVLLHALERDAVHEWLLNAENFEEMERAVESMPPEEVTELLVDFGDDSLEAKEAILAKLTEENKRNVERRFKKLDKKGKDQIKKRFKTLSLEEQRRLRKDWAQKTR